LNLVRGARSAILENRLDNYVGEQLALMASGETPE
jgi:hypothetical protein